MRTDTTPKVRRRLSFPLLLRVDWSTRSTTLLPAGIMTPSDPATVSPSVVVKRSPGLNVFVHTRATGVTVNAVPACTSPCVGAGAAAAGAEAAGAGAGAAAALGLSCAFKGRTTTFGGGSLGRCAVARCGALGGAFFTGAGAG